MRVDVNGVGIEYEVTGDGVDGVLAELQANGSLTPGLNYYRANGERAAQ